MHATAAMRTSRTVLSFCAAPLRRNGRGREIAGGLDNAPLVSSPSTSSSTTAAVASLLSFHRRRTFSASAASSSSSSSSSSSHVFSESEEDDELRFYRIRDRARKQERKTTRVPKAKGAAALKAGGVSSSSSSSASSSSSPPLPAQPRFGPGHPLRPTYADVDSVSRGGPSSKDRKGTGSRRVPHRLDAEERLAFDAARRKEGLSVSASSPSASASASASSSTSGGGGGGFVSLRGSGYRAERKGAPLANSWRSWCDVAGLPTIVLMRGGGGDPRDTVVADFSTLRLPAALAARALLGSGSEEAETAEMAASHPALPSLLSSLASQHGMSPLSEAEAAAACPFTHEARPRNNPESLEEEELEEVDLSATFVPIWQLLPWPLFAFEGGRAGARALASALSDREGAVGRLARAAVEEAARGRERAAAEAKKKAAKESAVVVGNKE